MKNKKKIPVFDFKLCDKEKEYVNDCLETSFITQGSYVKNFEKKFSKFVNCEHGITTTSGTTALHLACKTPIRGFLFGLNKNVTKSIVFRCDRFEI